MEGLRGQAVGDDGHVRYLAPVRGDELAAFEEVEPGGPEQVPAGRPADGEPHPLLESQKAVDPPGVRRSGCPT